MQDTTKTDSSDARLLKVQRRQNLYITAAILSAIFIVVAPCVLADVFPLLVVSLSSLSAAIASAVMLIRHIDAEIEIKHIIDIQDDGAA